MSSSDLTLRLQRVRIEAGRVRGLARPILAERLSGIHNAWGPAAGFVDTWAFLDLCEDKTVLDAAAELIGSDIVLWDSELYRCIADYRRLLEHGVEGRWWPVEPLSGCVAMIELGENGVIRHENVKGVAAAMLDDMAQDSALYVIRYMPATSTFVRDPLFPANWRAMEERPLVNLATRPLWLVRGADRALNDFVTGFAVTAPRWTEPTREVN